MAGKLIEIFTDKNLVEKIKKRLPYLFQLAELESSRAGKTGMEVGSVRERIIVALLIYKLPKAGTNPRGAEITKEALSNLVADKQCQHIIIEWQKTKIDFNPYKKWVDFWEED